MKITQREQTTIIKYCCHKNSAQVSFEAFPQSVLEIGHVGTAHHHITTYNSLTLPTEKLARLIMFQQHLSCNSMRRVFLSFHYKSDNFI